MRGQGVAESRPVPALHRRSTVERTLDRASRPAIPEISHLLYEHLAVRWVSRIVYFFLLLSPSRQVPRSSPRSGQRPVEGNHTGDEVPIQYVKARQ